MMAEREDVHRRGPKGYPTKVSNLPGQRDVSIPLGPRARASTSTIIRILSLP